MCDSTDHDHEDSTEEAREHLQLERRSFLKGAVVSGGAAATLAASVSRAPPWRSRSQG